MTKQQSQHGILRSPYLTSGLGLCHVTIVYMCYVLSRCARVMFLLLRLCVMCRLESVLCAGFSPCYVQFAVTNLVASEHASLRLRGSLRARRTRFETPML